MKSSRDAKDFQQRTGSQWIDSKSVKECKEKFTIINRKHHCRQCGRVVCNKCSPERVAIGSNCRARICLTCSDLSSHGSENILHLSKVDVCFICKKNETHTSDPLINGIVGPRSSVPLSWHKSCAKCRTCGTIMNLRDIHVNPPIGSILHTVPGMEVNCYCSAHISDMASLKSISRKTQCEPLTKKDLESQAVPPQQISYGTSPSQYFELHIPREAIQGSNAESPASLLSRRSVPVAVIIHGGFWKEKYRIDNSAIDSLTPFLLSSGMAVCLVEYRRISADDVEDEGGWPETNTDILDALRKLYQIVTEQDQPLADGNIENIIKANIDMDRVALIGHSAGGYLALWSCCCLTDRALPFKPALCVAIAPVCDLAEACRRRLSDEGDAVEKFMKCPFDGSTHCLQTFSEACPSKLLPLEVPSIIAVGTVDKDIPADMVEDFYWRAKKAGGEAAARAVSTSAAYSADSADTPISSPSPRGAENSGSVGGIAGDADCSNVAESRRQSPKHKSNKKSSSCVVPVSIKLVKLKDADHYDVVNAATPTWGSIFDEMLDMVPSLADIPEVDVELDRITIGHSNSSSSLLIKPLSSFASTSEAMSRTLLATTENDLGAMELVDDVISPPTHPSSAASCPSAHIRGAPERWASDMLEDDGKDVTCEVVSESSSSDEGEHEAVNIASSLKRESKDRDEPLVTHEASKDTGAEIFFFPTPKSDRPRRNSSFSFRFGRHQDR